MPELYNRANMHEAVTTLLNEETPHGKLVVPLKLITKDNGEHLDWAVNPLAFMHQAYLRCDGFRLFLNTYFLQRLAIQMSSTGRVLNSFSNWPLPRAREVAELVFYNTLRMGE